jgi:lipooligosaccharide transport system permease protein
VATLIIGIVISFFGLLEYPTALLIYPFSLIVGLAFAGFAMCFTALVPKIDTFNIPFFVFITPMYLFSGTFFPLENLPEWARYLAQIFPLTHAVVILRGAALGYLELGMLQNLMILIVFAILISTLSIVLMKRRLIK